MYRNVDGAKGGFGNVSVAVAVPDPDRLAAFAAERSSDAALTVMVINKQLDDAAKVRLQVANFAAADAAQRWELTASNRITRMPDAPLQGQQLDATLPAQSISLFVLAPAAQ
jgi:alpha-L-arabinofuranosidase